MDDTDGGWTVDPRHLERHRCALRAALADDIAAEELDATVDAALAIVARYVDLVGAGLNEARRNQAERRRATTRARRELRALVEAADALADAARALGEEARDALHQYLPRLKALAAEAGSLAGAADQARDRLESEDETSGPSGGPRRDEAAALMLQDAARLWISRTGRRLAIGGGTRRSPWERFAVAICKAAGAPKGVALARDVARDVARDAERPERENSAR